MGIESRSGISEEELAEIQRAVGRLRSLEEVVRVTLARGEMIAEIVVQDEFTHDVVVRWQGEVHLVYDTTCLGAVTAVAVWGKRPGAQELLEARLGRGWRPVPTDTKEGPVVMGNAACARVLS